MLPTGLHVLISAVIFARGRVWFVSSWFEGSAKRDSALYRMSWHPAMLIALGYAAAMGLSVAHTSDRSFKVILARQMIAQLGGDMGGIKSCP